ncbi:MAG: 1-deoxy-D-xylulose-5-phosphate reductoisomerase [Thermodesulfobacteriota bacterium]|nr:1-deoxy-D-xylulose-5-phosphate reductoisomerase [Thermodesulfobacteriota bacterium]
MKRLSILGSTGSIGRNVLRIVEQFPDRFSVVALAGGRNIDLLCEQIRLFSPEVAVVLDEALARELEERANPANRVEILYGRQGYEVAATLSAADLVVSAMVGSAGLLPTLAAIEHEKPVALANKECLVMAGELLMERARQKGIQVIPIDSEHNAIFQSLAGHRRQDLKQIFLTASGGPFLDKPMQDLDHMSPEIALRHPTWDMGPKITIDSATLMNKGLEVIEARWLFDVPLECIQVIIHPESMIHSMVAYRDGSVIAQLAIPDMRIPIAYALSYPERLLLGLPPPDFAQLGAFTFQEPDLERFPCLALAMEACKAGKTCPAVLNAANEVAVRAFLDYQIGFSDIGRMVEDIIVKHQPVPDPGLSDILSADAWARQEAAKSI